MNADEVQLSDPQDRCTHMPMCVSHAQHVTALEGEDTEDNVGT